MIFFDKAPEISTNPEIERVEKEKMEYFLLGSFVRTRGLRLYGYSYIKDELFEVQIQHGNTIHLMPIDGKLIPIDLEAEKCFVDSRCVYFENLNYRSALNRLNKYKQGKLNNLCNLRKYEPESIKIF